LRLEFLGDAESCPCRLTIEFSGGAPALRRIAAEPDISMTVGRVHLMVMPTAATTGYAARRQQINTLGTQHSVPSLAADDGNLLEQRAPGTALRPIMPAWMQRRNAPEDLGLAARSTTEASPEAAGAGAARVFNPGARRPIRRHFIDDRLSTRGTGAVRAGELGGTPILNAACADQACR
jgi:hypothetical protein